jgi:hypothetical protein
VEPLLRLGRRAEARKRLDAAFDRLRESGLYPVTWIDLGGETDHALRALAYYEGGVHKTARTAEIYEEILHGVRPAKSLSEAVKLSSLYALSADAWRRSGEPKRSAELAARRIELWRFWSIRLPGSAFVRQQIETASVVH